MDNTNECFYDNTTEADTNECPNCKSKKYRLHGKVVINKETDAIEVYYYECDNIQCKKLFIK